MTKQLIKLIYSAIAIFGTLTSFAQVKRDTLIYPMYFKTDAPVEYSKGEWVNDVKKANGYRLIISPDTVESNLFIVNDCFLNGDMRFRGKSIVKHANVKLHGTCIEYYKNNKPKAVSNYSNGDLIGEAVAYYPNGKLYFSGKYIENGIFEMYESRDSTGKAFVEGGNGEFIRYDSSFTKIKERGYYENALRTGEWRYFKDDSLTLKSTYDKGNLISGDQFDGNGKIASLPKPEIPAEYMGGIEAFYKSLEKTMRYPEIALRNNVQGKIFIAFIVEKDGSLSNIHVLRGIGSGCDEEAMRVVQLSSGKWKPGMQGGVAVRTQYTVPISFSIEDRRLLR